MVSPSSDLRTSLHLSAKSGRKNNTRVADRGLSRFEAHQARLEKLLIYLSFLAWPHSSVAIAAERRVLQRAIGKTGGLQRALVFRACAREDSMPQSPSQIVGIHRFSGRALCEPAGRQSRQACAPGVLEVPLVPAIYCPCPTPSSAPQAVRPARRARPLPVLASR